MSHLGLPCFLEQSGIDYICRRIMNKYSNKGPYPFEEARFRASYTGLHFKENLLKPANLNSKSDQLTLSAHSGNNHPDILTPRGKYGEKGIKMADLFGKSIRTTPTKERIRKDYSFVLLKGKEEGNCSKNDCSPTLTVSPKEVKNDRSQRVFPNRPLNNDASMRRIVEAPTLRQTVSNASAWQYRNLVPSTSNLSKKQTGNGQQAITRKKVQAEFHQVKDYKSKFASKQHSRNTSRTDQFFQNQLPIFTERTTPNARTPNKTPRVSKDHLLPNTKERIASQTDMMGNLCQPALVKRVSKVIQLSLEDFQLGSCKGQGRFGKVYPAIHRKTGAILAIKKVTKQSIRFMLDQFVQQIKICLFMNHPNIVRMYGFFTDRDNIYILMEYMEEGSLYKQVKMVKRFKEEETSNRLFEICEAVRYLHAHDILHRDIKPQNIVLTNGVAKLCDFGWATYSKQRRTTYCGTLDYVCPEILEGQSYDNFVDIWAIGVLAYEMLVGKAPFYHISRKETMKSIMSCEFSIPVDLSMCAKLFIMKALQKRPDQRFTIDSLLRDRFLAQSGHN